MSTLSQAKVFAAVVCRPSLWVTAVRQVFRLAPSQWYAHAPFLPIPPADFIEFRLVTQYGGEHGSAVATPKDVVDYLVWCRQWNDGRA
jgi:hypothetical protein